MVFTRCSVCFVCLKASLISRWVMGGLHQMLCMLRLSEGFPCLLLGDGFSRASFLCGALRCLRQLLPLDRLVGQVVKVPARKAEGPEFESRLRRDFSGSSHTSDLKLALQWLPCQTPRVIGSALGLFGPVSVYCDWER